MEYHISDRLASLAPSAIREIFKATADPSFVPFALGNPAAESFPTEAVARFTAEILAQEPVCALQYGITEGYVPLREALKARMKTVYGCGGAGDELIVVSGAQQGAELAAKALCDEGDVALCEEPSFIGVLNAFRSLKVRPRGIPLEADGLSLNALEQALKDEKRARLLYIIPNFQNPTGLTTSLEKRRAIYALARKYNILILEDNPYGELRFAGEDIPHIKSMDEDGRVIYLGTFSKILSAGLRVGYVLAPAPIVQKMVVAKQGEDVHTSMLSQMIAERFLKWDGFDAHLERARTLYRRKCGVMQNGIAQNFDARIRCTHPQGGLFLWCTLPVGSDMPAFVKAGVARKVAVVPGTAFTADSAALRPADEVARSFRLTFAAPGKEQIAHGLAVLGGLPF